MQHYIRKATLLSLWLCWACSGESRTTTPVLAPYIDAIKQLSHNCSMDYTASCSYPDKSTTRVAGRMAISGKNYYDSSNVRFVLMNSKWLLLAEHEPKMLSVVYLPDWKQRMGKEYELDISGYLLGDADEGNFSDFKMKAGKNDSFSVSVRYQSDGQAIDLLLFYVSGNRLPWRYEGVIHYTQPEAAQSKIPMDYMSVHFACSNIQAEADERLFREERLIQYTGSRNAHMLRYNDYKMYRRRR